MNEVGIATFVVVVLQFIAFAFGYGKLTQRVGDIDRRLTRLENRLNGK